MYILLNFINRTNSSDAAVVLFQKNLSAASDKSAIAYKVFKNFSPGASELFSFPVTLQMGAYDHDGRHYSPYATAVGGNTFLLQQANSTEISLYASVKLGDPAQIHLVNLLAKSLADAFLYRDYKMLARLDSIRPLDTAVFEIKNTIWVGVCNQVAEGGVMSAVMLSDIKTEFSLAGIKAADLVMTGDQGKYNFALENVIMG